MQSDSDRATSEEDEKVMNLKEKTLDYPEVEKNGGRNFARKASNSNDNDKSVIVKGSVVASSRSILKPTPSVSNLSSRKIKHEDLSHLSRP